MTDRARELLDKLLGPTRNLTEKEVEKLKDSDNCIFLLAGFCPFKALEHTKIDIGRCPYAQHKEIPVKYIGSVKLKMYETELLDLLEMVMSLFENRRKKIGISEGRVNLRLKGFEERIKLIINKAKEGKVDESLQLAEEIEAEAKYTTDQSGIDGTTRAHFCETCTTSISNVIESKEYRMHIKGRLHQACVKMRSVLAQLLLKYKLGNANFLTNKKRQKLSKLERISYKKKIV